MASRTWDGSREPEVHAEPLEPQMPVYRLDMISMDSPSINWKEKFALFGRRFVTPAVDACVWDLCHNAVHQVVAQLTLIF